ncbi:MAG TPA: 16S rRNA (guanine(527)-N(7))-methyltransferase RsmG [Bacteroidales bacterium]|jgi:16S rRNA (guanine527-N7)-methyltransferase|nr:16S rRNA (guanine(527)-N(7))-methyltransferase RsmG [Bacteroidales bacterium]MCZ2417581.1 16S rRNA (guanine(527)-N(7))-methyltransferase RsmG [Burkholderiales bacterium]OQC56750.1 MAG: Ribosomal RNA small subunit methyltransferase G [Bacteroidetes bacterium ADurb.Bin013]MBV6456815.1 Ribosomal RNA small subunit methyltransferase G [Bacteroidales bacterium]MCZ2316582.1 16S rRNA (guanine(527)-N(7))-methyltransferase RsmG [Bacteroidales bacterium]
MDADVVFRFFPHLDQAARKRIMELAGLYAFWNERINVISRKDLEHLYVRHVLHSLTLSAAIKDDPFQAGATVLDAGTGGGFPGIPLAILHPQSRFILCDSIAKKIKVVREISDSLGLDNVTAVVSRVEQMPDRCCDVMVSRAVTSLAGFIPWTRNKLREPGRILFLKGGDLEAEIKEAAIKCRIPASCFSVTPLADTYRGLEDDFFETKKICEIKQTSYLCAPLLKSS